MGRLYINQHDFIEVDKGKSLSQEIATRSSAYDFSTFFGFLPNPDPVLKAEGRDIDVYEGLLHDAHVGAVVDSLIDGVKSLEWEVDRGRAQSRHAKNVKDWFEDFDMHSFAEGVVGARLFGYQPFEILWKYLGNLLLPYEAIAKPQKWFRYDPEGRLRFVSRDNPSEGELLDMYPRKFLVPRYKATYNNPYGTGVLSRVFWPILFKKGGLKFWITFTERFGMPHVWIKVPVSATTAEREAMLAMGKAMIQDGVSVTNDTDNLSLVESKGTSASTDLYLSMLNFQNDEISKAVKGETLTTQLSSGGGSFAASKTHENVSQTGINSITRLVTRSINQLVQWYMEVNVSESVTVPVIAPYEEDDVDTALGERDNKLSTSLQTSGLRFTKKYYQRAYGFEEDDIESIGSAAGAGSPAQIGVDPANNTPPAGPSFAEGSYPDQEAVDAMLDSLTAADLQAQMDPLMQPVLDLVKNAKNFSEASKGLAKVYPKMPTGDLEKVIAQMMFEAEVRGRIEGAKP